MHQKNTDKYKLLKVIGEGAFGLVFQATCDGSKKKVAIKYVDLSDSNKTILISVCKEVKINQHLSKLSSNIFTPRLLDAYMPLKDMEGEVDELNGIYMVFDYIRFTLRDALDSR